MVARGYSEESAEGRIALRHLRLRRVQRTQSYELWRLCGKYPVRLLSSADHCTACAPLATQYSIQVLIGAAVASYNLTLYTQYSVPEAHCRFRCYPHGFRDGGGVYLRSLRYTRLKTISNRSGIPADDAQFCIDLLCRHRSIAPPPVQFLHLFIRVSAAGTISLCASLLGRMPGI